MQYTTNHNFNLPEGADRFNIQHQNDNWSSLDTLLEDYLPLTAGSTKPLSSPLYIENIYGKARLTVGSAGGVTLAARNEEDDTSIVGFHSFISDNKGYAIVFGNGGEIRLRPNGITNTTGQVCIDTTGQQIGGHPITYSDKSLAISGDNLSKYVTMQTINFTQGTWILLSYMDTNSSASTTYNHRVALSNGYDKTVRNSMASGGGSLNGQMFNVSSSGATCTIYTYTSTATTIRNTVWYVRIQ